MKRVKYRVTTLEDLELVFISSGFSLFYDGELGIVVTVQKKHSVP